MTIDEALAKIDEISCEFECEFVDLLGANGRILGEDIIAENDAPLFSNSAMDGYALISSEIKQPLKIIGSTFAGDAAGEIKSGECIKIMTGAPIPRGADAVLMVENSSEKDGFMHAGVDEIAPKTAIRFQGEEYKKGEILLSSGTEIGPEHILLLAANGYAKVCVRKKIETIVFASGAELIEPASAELGIRNSNSYAIISAIQSFANATYGGIIKDNYEAVLGALKGACKHYELIVTIGAASMGDADFMKKALGELGFCAVFNKISLKPGGPVALYQRDKKFVLVLPGNPMSSFVCAMLFARKLIYKMMATRANEPYFYAPIASDLFIKNKKENVIFGVMSEGKFQPFADGKFSSGQCSVICKNTHFIRVLGEIKKDEIIKIYELKI